MRSPVSYVIQLYNALNEVEQKVFLDQVDPQSEPEEQPKKSNKRAARKGRCAACDYAKAASIHHDNKLVGYHVYQSTSRSAQSTSAVIAKTPKAETGNGADEESEDAGPLCGTCGNVAAYQDHFKPSPNYHPFEAPAPIATQRSSRRSRSTKASESSTPNSETPAASAAVAAGGSSE